MSRRYSIPLSQNPIDAKLLSSILHRYDGQNPVRMIHDFEGGLSHLMEIDIAVALDSGTAAIHLSLKSLGVAPGDVVIAPTFTYVASISPLLYLGARPILVDCEPGSWNMDPQLMQKAIETCLQEGKKPKAIIAVHTYGMPANMQEIMRIANAFDIPVMEDAAEAIGATYQGKPLGRWGKLGVLSFNNNKILTTYGGGAVLTRDDETARQILYWATHARKDLPYYQHDEVGYNYRMSPLAAAAGIAGFELLGLNVAHRRAAFSQYQKKLAHHAEISWQEQPNDAESNRWFSCLVIRSGSEKVRQALLEEGTETRPLWKPMHQQPLFSGCSTFLNGTADRLFETGLCLPSGNDLTTDQLEKVVAIISENI